MLNQPRGTQHNVSKELSGASELGRQGEGERCSTPTLHVLADEAGWTRDLKLCSRHDPVRLEENSGSCHFCLNCDEMLFPPL